MFLSHTYWLGFIITNIMIVRFQFAPMFLAPVDNHLLECSGATYKCYLHIWHNGPMMALTYMTMPTQGLKHICFIELWFQTTWPHKHNMILVSKDGDVGCWGQLIFYCWVFVPHWPWPTVKMLYLFYPCQNPFSNLGILMVSTN